MAVLTEERIGYTIGNSLVLLDGIPIVDHEVIFKYDPLKIRKIDVYKGKYVFGGQIFDGIASFSSYEHNYPGLVVDNSTQFFDYEARKPSASSICPLTGQRPRSDLPFRISAIPYFGDPISGQTASPLYPSPLPPPT